ncbi:hypothetical protein M670_03353 [Schinkia azotoformans MEV2011]|uniref:Uncharacterized protein n=1 Tax=Schinkia azotoformans MEV2011 TaxID=1348973 RepID=A0A072NHY8_SCHAZ|nr:hypothetical protein [Schinkia azotoformans]KEF37319.1 hypothetical protein M670_03353 [Schinkia azotoformans MEV2011]MEC1694543.1 hypothetical protein [Schinkia azotoformans]MEC1718305.1 hypothetical protein [Schinkia azotoformans]MEC1725604.1 hypothetical protein [Schinkia azotoformans]MEC1742610.1 hypothetical protein [Schinkia azotoformans]
MNSKDYQQYLLDLKDWSDQVETILKEQHVDEEAYLAWKQQMENLMKQIEEKIEKSEIKEDDILELEKEARGLYEGAKKVKRKSF